MDWSRIVALAFLFFGFNVIMFLIGHIHGRLWSFRKNLENFVDEIDRFLEAHDEAHDGANDEVEEEVEGAD